MGVQSDSINKLAQVHNEQVKKGMATYGRPLSIFNGRSAYDDAMAEVVDLAAYVTQLDQERTCLKLALEALYGACVRFLGVHGSSTQHFFFRDKVDGLQSMLKALGYEFPDQSRDDALSAFDAFFDEVMDDRGPIFAPAHDISASIMSAPFVHVDAADAVGPVQEEENLTQTPEWDEGWDAGVRGLPWQVNPYCIGETDVNSSFSARAWEDGWEVGRKRWLSGSSDFRRDLEAREEEQENIDAALYDSGNVGIDNTPEPIVPCPQCGQPQVWESGDDSVGMPGYWYCERCQEEEGVVEDEP